MTADFKVLVTGVGGDIGVNILRCLQEGAYGPHLVGCDMDPHAFGRDCAPMFLQCPSASNQQAYKQFVDSVILNRNVRYIFPSSENEIRFFHATGCSYGKDDVHILINNATILDHFLDKYLTCVFLKKHGLPHPRTFLLGDYSGELGFPVVLKKRYGSGSKLVLIVENQGELDFYKGKYAHEGLVVQEHLGNKDEEYTAGVFSDGPQTFCILFRRYLAKDVGITRYAELVDEGVVKALAVEIARVSGLKGSINLQMRKVGQTFIPFEINPRISGTAFVRHFFGFKDVEWWLDMTRGLPVRYTPKYSRGIAIRAVSEVFQDLC